MMNDSSINYSDVQQGFKDLRWRINDELKRRLILKVTKERARFYQGKNLLGVEVEKAFPSASIDTEEAGKCCLLGGICG
jgi:hypothetical protein